MPRFLFFKDTRFKVIKLTIHPHTDMRVVLDTVDSIRFPDFGVSDNNIRYAILELLNNSLRAHREKGTNRRISVLFRFHDKWFRISVRDFGGGFDVQKLPYPIHAKPSKVDPNSKELIQYRKTNHYLKFGLGLYLVKKTFHKIRITFFDEHGLPGNWRGGKTVGTLINLELGARSP